MKANTRKAIVLTALFIVALSLFSFKSPAAAGTSKRERKQNIPPVSVAHDDILKVLKDPKRLKIITEVDEITAQSQNVVGVPETLEDENVLASGHYDTIKTVMGARERLIEDVSKPNVILTDFHNGTTLTTIDYQNGTRDEISKTTTVKTAKVQLGHENILNQLMSAVTPISKNESTGYITVTQDLVMEQEVLMGFTYELIAKRYTIIDLDIEVAYARAGIEVDIGFGMRLPVRITLEYPEYMILGHDYELYATLTPLDRPDYDEFLCKFKANIWVEAGIWIPFVGWEEYSYSFGPDYDWSSSFATPFGAFPIPPLEITVWDLWLMAVKAVIYPELGGDDIRATVSTGGDAVLASSPTMGWWYPDQRIPFTVHVDEHGSNGFADIVLSDFRYYFHIFKLNFNVKFDFGGWIDWLTGDPTIHIYTLDLDWLWKWFGGPYLRVHSGTDGTVDVRVPVWEYVYEDTHGRGTTLRINTRTPEKRFQFTTPDQDYGIRNIVDMRQFGCHSIVIRHYDSELRLLAVTTTKLDFCQTTAWDLQTKEHYVLVDNPGIE